MARGVLDVDVVDAVGEGLEEQHGVDELVVEMAGIEVDPEGGAVADRRERLLRRDDVVGNLRRMDLQAEAHALLVEDVDDRVPAVGELAVAGLDGVPVVGREGIQQVPDGRAREAVDLGDAEAPGGARGVHELLGGALPDALGIAVTPDAWREDAPVPLIDEPVGHALADEVVADGPAAQAVLLEERASPGHVGGVGQGFVYLEMVTPAGELEAVVAPAPGQKGQLGNRNVRELSREQGNRSYHDWSSSPPMRCRILIHGLCCALPYHICGGRTSLRRHPAVCATMTWDVIGRARDKSDR